MEIIIGYIIVINLSGIIIMGYDKDCAQNYRWRVPEKTLLLLCLAGGSIGVFMGMRLFRHKTRHKLFTFGVPSILLAQMWLIAYSLLKTAGY
ncbi:MAG: DUF1294 domain-containing protein [Firmicutes bacterium]|nr:DUF1294 domain-containing protein [Bacillota bacterium]